MRTALPNKRKNRSENSEAERLGKRFGGEGKMIDFHTHALFGLDDGAANEAESCAIFNAEISQGVHTVVLTPHYYCKYRSPKQFVELRKEHFERLRKEIPPSMRVLLGAEVHFEEETVLSFEDFHSLAIEGTNLVLVEFPFYHSWKERLFDKLSRFATESGCTPVIAHVERYEGIHKHPKLLGEFVRRGWLLQVNTASFYDKRNASLVIAMLKHGMIHCLGTDSHNMTDRAPDYEECRNRIKKIGLEKEWSLVQTSMQRLLDGQKLSPCDSCVHRFGHLYF